MSKIRMLVMVLSVFGSVLFGSSVATAQIRTVLVSPVPGDPIASGTALRNALAGIPSPSQTNPWLLKIEPGIYQLQDTSLQMRSWVNAAGIWFASGTVIGLDISDSKIIARLAASQTKGIFQGGTPAVFVRHSSIEGATKTVESTAGSISIQGTALFGGPATAGPNGWQGCMGVWDEMGVFYTTGCPQ